MNIGETFLYIKNFSFYIHFVVARVFLDFFSLNNLLINRLFIYEGIRFGGKQ